MATLWADSIVSLSIASSSRSLVNLGLPDLTALQRRIERFTLIRTIIGIDIMPVVRDSGEGDQLLSLGILVSSDTADITTEIADPADGDSHPLRGWVWRYRTRCYASAVDDQNIYGRRVDMDLRSQRKIENGRPRLVVRNEPNQGVATAFLVSGLIRMLYLVG